MPRVTVPYIALALAAATASLTFPTTKSNLASLSSENSEITSITPSEDAHQLIKRTDGAPNVSSGNENEHRSKQDSAIPSDVSEAAFVKAFGLMTKGKVVSEKTMHKLYESYLSASPREKSVAVELYRNLAGSECASQCGSCCKQNGNSTQEGQGHLVKRCE